MFNKRLDYLIYFQRGLKTQQSSVNVNVLWLLELKYLSLVPVLSWCLN